MKVRMSGWAVALLVAMKVQAAGSCPAAADVERHLGPLLSSESESMASGVARIDEGVDGGLTISLTSTDGSTVAQRHLPRASSCAEQAEIVAVALAAWEARVHPDISLRLDHLSPASAPDVLVTRIDVGPPAAEVTHVGLGASLAGDWQRGSIASAGRIELTISRGERPWRGRLSLAGLGTHTIDVSSGQASWWRIYGALGADYILRTGPLWDVVVGAAGVLGQASIGGAGFPVNRRTRSADLGGESVLRIQRRVGRITPWVGLAAVVWLRRQGIEVTGSDGSLALPRVEPMVALGADFRW
jgi:hypothetical protein